MSDEKTKPIIATTRKTKRLKSITDEEFKTVNEDNQDLIDEYLEYSESVDRSPATIRQYRSDLRIIMMWFKDHAKNKDFTSIKKRDVVKFQNWCIKQEMSPARIRGLRSAMSSLSIYIESMMDDLHPEFRNVVNQIPAPNLTAVREKTVLSDEQVEGLLEELVDQKRYQQACFVAILAGSGMRKSEVIQCKVDWFVGEDVKIYEGMYVSPMIRTKGSGVLGKVMSKYIIQDIAQKYIDLWMKEREELGIDHESLFVIKRRGEYGGIKDSTVDSWMILFSRITGEVCYSHAFRHYALTWLRKHKVSIDVIRDFAGHNDSATTELYIDIDASENLSGMLSFMNKDDEGNKETKEETEISGNE